MFKFFKRSIAPDPVPSRRRKSAAKSHGAEVVSGPTPLPQVSEGNEQSDWALWEDSMTAMDSQMQSLGFLPSHHARLEEPTDRQELDAYSKVAKKDD